jgi:predicted dehydrogenase
MSSVVDAPSTRAHESRRPISVGLIGAGRMGRSHLLAASGLGLSIQSICDVNPKNLDSVGGEFHVDAGRRLATPEAFFDQAEVPELVIISTTADSHARLTIAAAEAGARFVLCEKPMATSVADCDRMLEACARHGARLAINHQMRFMDQYVLVKNELTSEAFGGLGSMNVVAGCFGLVMNGSHYFEAFRYLTESPIVEVAARFDAAPMPSPRGPKFFDRSGHVSATAASGRRIHIEAAADQGHGMTVTYAARRGHVIVDELEGVYYAVCRKPEHRDLAATRFGMPWERREHMFPQADNVGPTSAVLTALITGNNEPTGEDGRAVVAALAAAYRSHDEGGRPVRVADNQSDHDRVFPWA